MDIRKKRQGKCLERVGHYDPLEPKEENKVQFNAERIRFWAEQGAQASETVEKLLKARGMSWGRVKSAEKVAATVASS
jgi:small subunit ribosomal protein S16